jgi:hypothetical protein
VIGELAETVHVVPGVGARKNKNGAKMRILIAALVVMITCPALADEVDDARRLAVSGR